MSNTNLNLGRSINDLLEENKADYKRNEEVLEIALNRIKPNPDQPRTRFDSNALNELAESIKEHGVIQPIILKPGGNGEYILVAGERRVKASELAGKKTIPSIIRDYNEVFLSELAILENIQREDLSPIEEAIALQNALVRLDLTHEQLGKKIGKSRSYITNSVGLLNLPAIVIKDVNNGGLSMGHARVLSKIRNQEVCLKLHKRILKEQLTVRELELVVREMNRKEEISIISADKVAKVQEKLEKSLPEGTKFKIRKNKLVFSFQSEDELNDIIEIVLGGRNG